MCWDGGFDEREDGVAAEVVEDEGEEVGGFVGDGYGAGGCFVEEGISGEEAAGEHGGRVVLKHGGGEGEGFVGGKGLGKS